MELNFGEKLKAARLNKGFKQSELAKQLGVTNTTISNWEKNVSKPDLDMLSFICGILNVKASYFLAPTLPDGEISIPEFEIIEKYRKLDNFGKENVDIVINRELNRIEIYGKLNERKIITLAEYEPTKPPTYLIPYWEEGASAGNGIYQLNDTESIMMTLWASELTKQADFIIKVSGDSMEPDFYDGDKVLVDRKVRVEKGDVGIFWKDGNTYIKEMGENELISRNPKRANIPTDDFNRVICMGKVIGKLTDEMIAID